MRAREKEKKWSLFVSPSTNLKEREKDFKIVKEKAPPRNHAVSESGVKKRERKREREVSSSAKVRMVSLKKGFDDVQRISRPQSVAENRRNHTQLLSFFLSPDFSSLSLLQREMREKKKLFTNC